MEQNVPYSRIPVETEFSQYYERPRYLAGTTPSHRQNGL